MKRIFPLLIILCLYSAVFAQTKAPGGVGGEKLWFFTQKKADNVAFWQGTNNKYQFLNNLSNRTIPSKSKLLNFNEALYFDGIQNSMTIPLQGTDFSKSTFFVVYQPEDSLQEKNIWCFEKNNLNYEVLTTQRIADLEFATYMNYAYANRLQARMVGYVQSKQKGKESDSNQRFQFGGKPNTQNLPIVGFKGVIPEFLVYDRVLNSLEQLQVSSYLSLKYGLTLNHYPYPIYLNSKGKTIWDGHSNKPYNHRIAGLGRDDCSGLYQKQAANSEHSNILTIGVSEIAKDNATNNAEMQNNSFLIWGEDNGKLMMQSQTIGQPQLLQRKWLMSRFGDTQGLKTDLEFDIKAINRIISSDETWYLIIDHSGTGNFPIGKLSYHKSAYFNNHQVVFEDIKWDVDSSGTDVFTIGVGNQIMPIMWIDAPTCIPFSLRSLDIGAVGDNPPYSFNLTNLDTKQNLQWQAEENELQKKIDLQSGDYKLEIIDSKNANFQTQFFLQNEDAETIPLDSQYVLSSDMPLRLDAFNNIEACNMAYSWSGPDKFNATSASVFIKNPGVYTLTVDKSGCISKKEFKVVKANLDNFNRISLFPNPSVDGQFKLDVWLKDAAKLEVKVFDMFQRIIWQNSFPATDYHYVKAEVPYNGIYIINLTSNQSTKSIKFEVIEK